MIPHEHFFVPISRFFRADPPNGVSEAFGARPGLFRGSVGQEPFQQVGVTSQSGLLEWRADLGAGPRAGIDVGAHLGQVPRDLFFCGLDAV